MATEQNPTTIDAKTLEAAADIYVFDSHGGQIRFGDIFADRRTIVVFIRTPNCRLYSYVVFSDNYVLSKGHFFCGVRHAGRQFASLIRAL
jgi:hypothetical protein